MRVKSTNKALAAAAGVSIAALLVPGMSAGAATKTFNKSFDAGTYNMQSTGKGCTPTSNGRLTVRQTSATNGLSGYYNWKSNKTGNWTGHRSIGNGNAATWTGVIHNNYTLHTRLVNPQDVNGKGAGNGNAFTEGRLSGASCW